MREFFQSCATLTFAMSLLSVELADHVTSESRELRGAAAKALDAVSNTAVDQLGPRLRSTFRGLNDVQRNVVGIMFDLSLEMARSTLKQLTDEDGADRQQRVLLD